MRRHIIINQIYKRHDNDFVKSVFEKYLSKQLSVKQNLDILKIRRSRFFVLLILFELNEDKKLITSKNVLYMVTTTVILNVGSKTNISLRFLLLRYFYRHFI